MRQKILNLPQTYAPRLFGLKNVGEVRKFAEGAAISILNDQGVAAKGCRIQTGCGSWRRTKANKSPRIQNLGYNKGKLRRDPTP